MPNQAPKSHERAHLTHKISDTARRWLVEAAGRRHSKCMWRSLGSALGACVLLVACGSDAGSSDESNTWTTGSGGGSTASAADTTSATGSLTNGSTTTGGATQAATTSAGSGVGPTLANCSMFPADNPWNTDISDAPVHPNSDAFIDSIGRDTHLHPDFGTEWEGSPIGIPYTLVDSSQPTVQVAFEYDDESDPGPYPIPPDAPIEGGANASGDRHVLVVETDSCILYELFAAYPVGGGDSWEAGSGAIFDLKSNVLRPARWTSADAAGLPILPGLVRYDEVVEKGAILHALRFTVAQSQSGYVPPATHAASSSDDPRRPPMGLRVRMKSSFDCSGFSNEVRVICTALKRFGMFVADNGSDWYLSGAYDPRWSDNDLGDLKQIPGDAFEAIDTGPIEPW